MKDKSALRDYLSYYQNLKAPGYAVLVTGSWGSGKTYQVNSCIHKDKCIYVSLFGLNSVEAIYGEILAKMDPITSKAKSGLKAVTEKAKDFGGLYGASGAIITGFVNALIQSKFDSEKLIILDDLERCPLEPKALLGVINRLVEHHECKVVVIAHDEKLEAYFSEANEKVFGQTLKILPQFDEAFDAFKSTYDKKTQIILRKLHDDFLELFTDGEIGSLRILRYTMADTVRFLNALRKSQKTNLPAIREFTRLFIALSYEVKSSRLGEIDIVERSKISNLYVPSIVSSAISSDIKPEKTSIVQSNERYKTLDLNDHLLSDQMLNRMLIQGCYDHNEIQFEVNKSRFFAKVSELRPWQQVIQFQKLSDDVVNKALERFKIEFKTFVVTEVGELLQVFSIKLMLSKNNIVNESLEQVKATCIAYIDSLYKMGKLPNGPLPSKFDRGYDGWGYWIESAYSKIFSELKAYLEEKVQAVRRDEFPEKQKTLLTLLETSPELFYRQVCYSNTGKPEFADRPILATIDPAVFIESWLTSPIGEWHWIESALVDRQLQGSSVVEQERLWKVSVVENMRLKIGQFNGLAKFRLQIVLKNLSKKFDLTQDNET